MNAGKMFLWHSMTGLDIVAATSRLMRVRVTRKMIPSISLPKLGLHCSRKMAGYYAVGVALICCLGCGTTRENQATQQLLMSDAVDRSVAKINFTPLSGETVYLESRFLQEVKGTGFVNANYIISSLRQQLAAAGALIQDTPDAAEYIVEARVGTLGSDGHDVQYGIPASSPISSAAGLVSGAPPIPILPEISFARKTEDTAAAKIALFAYHRETRRPVWQSGTSVAQSNSSGRWILGAGPFETGSIHEGTRFAGGKLDLPRTFGRSKELSGEQDLALRESAYRDFHLFDPGLQKNMVQLVQPPETETADHEPATLKPGQYVMEIPQVMTKDSQVQQASAEMDSEELAKGEKPASSNGSAAKDGAESSPSAQ